MALRGPGAGPRVSNRDRLGLPEIYLGSTDQQARCACRIQLNDLAEERDTRGLGKSADAATCGIWIMGWMEFVAAVVASLAWP
jgi:hypothetical protein